MKCDTTTLTLTIKTQDVSISTRIPPPVCLWSHPLPPCPEILFNPSNHSSILHVAIPEVLYEWNHVVYNLLGLALYAKPGSLLLLQFIPFYRQVAFHVEYQPVCPFTS